MKKEVRFITGTELRVQIVEGKPPIIEGYAAVFNTWSRDLGGFKERIMPGAFSRAIKDNADVRALMNHEPNLILARTKSGTLKLEEDERGLRFRAQLPETTYARNLQASIARGDIDQCSFSFKAVRQTWGDEKLEDGKFVATRELLDVDLYDVSAVTFPAYEGTSLATRWAEVVPAEVRSAVEQREKESVVVARVYTEADVPDYVPKDSKAQWAAVWNSAYQKALDDGKSKDDAEASAFAQANAVAGPNADKKSSATPKEKRDDMISWQDILQSLDKALGEKFGCDEHGWPKMWMVETFDDYLIGCKDGNDYYKVTFSLDPDGNVTLGDLEPVDLAYVPADQVVVRSSLTSPDVIGKVKRGAVVTIPLEVSLPPKRLTAEELELEKKRRAHMDDPECDDPDCEDPECDCQNVMVEAAGLDDEDLLGYGEDEEEEEEEEEEENSRRIAELRAAGDKVRTKRVGGKNLTKNKFAYVGDPNDTSTWKLPIHDAAHARNALARFNQVQGIPADKKAGVYKKILAAAKKFGIEVSEENEARMRELAVDAANIVRLELEKKFLS